MKKVLLLSIKFYLLFFEIALSISAFSQNQKIIDSLEILLKKSKEDSSKVIVLNKLNTELRDINPVKANKYSFEALALSRKISYEKGIAHSLNSIGILYHISGEYDSAMNYYAHSLRLYKRIKDKTGTANCLNNIGALNDYKGNYDIALTYHFEALKIREEINDKRGISTSLDNISIIFNYQGNYDKALEYALKALKQTEQTNDKKQIAMLYNNISVLYLKMKNYQNALKYSMGSLKIEEGFGDKHGIAVSLNNIGLIYDEQNNKTKALYYYEKSLRLKQEIKDIQGIAATLNNISDIYRNSKDFDRAIKAAEDGLKYAKELNSKELLKDIYNSLAASNALKKDYKTAYEYHELYMEYKDSLLNEQSTLLIADMQNKYESEKKQKEIELLNKDKEIQKTVLLKTEAELKQQRILKFAFIIGFVLMFVLFFVLFRSYRFKKKSNILLAKQKCEIEEKNEELNQQNEEIAAQRDRLEDMNIVLEKKNEEIEKIHNELTDSINYAKRIQESMLPDLELLLTAGNLSADCQLLTANYGLPITNYFVLFKPKDIVSGDFYWTTMVNKWLIITVADCTGHGVPGAFMSMLGISFLNEIVRKEEITKASEVLDHLRELIIEALQQKGILGEQQDGMDIAFCALNTETLEMQFAGANNPCYIISNTLPVIARNEAISYTQADCFVPRNDDHQQPPATASCQLFELKGDKQPIGIHTNMQPFTNQNYQLQKGDTIYLMSDGYEDQFGGPNCKKFLSKNLKQLLTASCLLPLIEQKQIHENTITEWIGTGEQTDDITILGIKI